ncbi:MAG: formylglycine-generating enzyme family protein, partial [Planctomycetaceae bacterium]|nr:formylglycine-generating enzyme family protein [Planctomycetaceae bacterium]
AAEERDVLHWDSDLGVGYCEEEQPQHTVRISRPYYMGMYEVTQGEYKSVVGTNPAHFSSSGGGSHYVSGLETSRFPVESVSWEDAVEFCRKLSAKDGMTYRLPTEAEWEYACRARTTTPFHFGTVSNGHQANSSGNFPFGTRTKGPSLGRSTTVGSFAKNTFGLFDMHGNVEEWCDDVYDASVYAKRSGTTIDPKVTSNSHDSDVRVRRGGYWANFSYDTRSAHRRGGLIDERFKFYGFRVVLSAASVRSQ